MKKEKSSKLMRVFLYYSYLLIVWGFFRLFFKLDEVIEEFWVKPLIWLIPLLGVWLSEKDRVVFFRGSPIKAIGWGLMLGLVWLGVVAVSRFGRQGNIGFFESEMNYGDILGAALATAIVEEIVFSGYIFQNIYKGVKSLTSATLTTAIMFSMIHVPIGLFVYKYQPVQLLGFLLVVGLVEMGSSYVMYRSNNVVAPIIANFMWAVAMVALV